MRPLPCLTFLCICLCAIGSADIKLTVSQAGRNLGTMSFSAVVDATGKTTSFKTKIGTATVVETERVDLLGQLISRSIKSPATDSEVRFAPNGDAIVTQRSAGHAVRKRFPFRARGTRKDPSEYWFIKSKPKPGTFTTFCAFDLDHNAWTINKVRFVGRRSMVAAGRKVAGNIVDQKLGSRVVRLWLDDAGEPISIQTGSLRIVRAW